MACARWGDLKRCDPEVVHNDPDDRVSEFEAAFMEAVETDGELMRRLKTPREARAEEHPYRTLRQAI